MVGTCVLLLGVVLAQPQSKELAATSRRYCYAGGCGRQLHGDSVHLCEHVAGDLPSETP